MTLAGIDSVMCSRSERLGAWRRLGSDLDISKLAAISNEDGLNEVMSLAGKLLNGEVRGRKRLTTMTATPNHVLL